jgi:sugar (pentulose or hexulose) kinase
LDSVGFAIRANSEQIVQVAGRVPESLTLSGGLSRSAALVRRIANIAGTPVRVAGEPESAALGCAILAAAGAGLHPDLEAAARTMTRAVEVAPDPQEHERYGPAYAKWRELYRALDDLAL